jgi:GTP cyclohydrolase III
MTSSVFGPAQAMQNASRTTADAGSAPSANDSTESTTTRVLVTEQDVALSTAAVMSAPATARHRSPRAMLIAAIGHIRIRLPEARPFYPRREGSYFETARMSRAMYRL